MVGACQYKMRKVPPLPRLPAGAAAGAAAAGAAVAGAAGFAGSAGLGAGVGVGLAQAANTNDVAAVKPNNEIIRLLFIYSPFLILYLKLKFHLRCRQIT